MEGEKKRLALVFIISLFFMWGLITVLNDILVPHLKALFSLSYAQVMLIQFSFFMAYGIMSIPSGKIIEKVGYKASIMIALATSSIGAWLFLPASSIPSYTFFLLAIFVLATGIVLLQVAANPYVALLGPHETASSRLNLAQAFNSLGTTLGPLIGSYMILAVFSGKSEVFGIHLLYSAIAILLLFIGLLLFFIKLPIVKGEEYKSFQETLSEHAKVASHEPKPTALEKKTIWQFPHLLWGTIAIFLYVGAEVSIGSFLVNFLMDSDILGLSKVAAGRHVSFYWGSAMVGRFIGFFLLMKIRPRKLLSFATLMAMLLILLTIIFKGTFSGYSVLSIGLFNSIMFPTIFTLAIRGLDRFTAEGSGLLCTAIVGGAIIPLLQGVLADMIGVHHAFLIPFLCYLYIFFYARRGAVAKCSL